MVHQPPGRAEEITVTVFKVTGETNTDDLSPAPGRLEPPGHPAARQLAMLKNARDGINPDKPGTEIGPIKQIEALKAKGNIVAYVGDVVGTGSSRKSATNSVLWFTGDDMPFVPNKRDGGVCIGSKIAPIFFNTMEDAGALPIELDVAKMGMGDVVDIYPYKARSPPPSTATRKSTPLKTDGAAGRSARRWPYQPDHRPRPDRQGP
jgi:aconitate hydratase 2/2-methylisocitrate dehydratase